MHAVGVLEAGLCNYVLISYGHSGRSGDSMMKLLYGMSGNDAVFGHFGAAAGYAMAARRAMHEFNTGPDTWKKIAVGQRRWANLNPRAMMHDRPLTEAEYDRAPYTVEPFRLYDNCLVADGGRACVITSLKRARDLPHPPVSIMGLGMHSPAAELAQAGFLAGSTGARRAMDTALHMAGITRDAIDACEIYDCFTYTVEITMQDYGFFGPGEGGDWFKGGTIEPGGRMPVNTSGGLLSEAYQMGLTPLTEGVMQLMGRCEERQLGPGTGNKTPEIILCSDNGGILQSHACYILRRV